LVEQPSLLGLFLKKGNDIHVAQKFAAHGLDHIFRAGDQTHVEQGCPGLMIEAGAVAQGSVGISDVQVRILYKDLHEKGERFFDERINIRLTLSSGNKSNVHIGKRTELTTTIATRRDDSNFRLPLRISMSH